jgi:hypothetical protein
MLERSYVLGLSQRTLKLVFDEPCLRTKGPSCRFTISLDGDVLKDFIAYGTDEIHSLQMAFNAADANLQFYQNKLGEPITWNGQTNFGLVPKCLSCGRSNA